MGVEGGKRKEELVIRYGEGRIGKSTLGWEARSCSAHVCVLKADMILSK